MSKPKTKPNAEARADSLQRRVRGRLTADDWDDAADLFEQGAAQAEHAYETHSADACTYAVERLNSLAMWATGKAMLERQRAKSPNNELKHGDHDQTHEH